MTLEAQVEKLLEQMTLEEKVAQMSGESSTWGLIWGALRGYNRRPILSGTNRRLGVPPLAFSDGPRGVVMYRSTAFPAAIGRGATWDRQLEERVGEAMGAEALAQGATLLGSTCINLLRHPAWGRAQETFGEDPWHMGAMASAHVRGVSQHVMACVKHFAANSMEDMRFKVDVRMNPRTLHEVYLPHFRRSIEAGAVAVMSAYNQLNGAYCGHNAYLLRTILKERWNFGGFVLSDFVFGLRDARQGIEGGLDLEMPVHWHFGRPLVKLVRSGQVDEALVDDGARRILRAKLHQAQRKGEGLRPRVSSDAHRALARECARKSMVLLQNEPAPETPVLPLPTHGHLAVIGRRAKRNNTGDIGSSRVRPRQVVRFWDGIRRRFPGPLDYASGRSLARARRAAARAEAAIVVVGLDTRDEGENILFWGGDRSRLTLRPADERLIAAVSAANPRTVVVVVGGSAILMESWRRRVPAILMAWYPGMEGGDALADLLFGDHDPSGRLPFVIPQRADHLPEFTRKARSVDYGLLHGHRFGLHHGHTPAFHFGHGLSYTHFELSSPTLDRKIGGPGDTIGVSCEVRNRGERPGSEVVQVYAAYPDARVFRPPLELVGFERVTLEPGRSAEVQVNVEVDDLAYFDEDLDAWKLPTGIYELRLGTSSDPTRLSSATFRVPLDHIL